MEDEDEDDMYEPLLDDIDVETRRKKTTLTLKRGHKTSYGVCNSSIPP